MTQQAVVIFTASCHSSSSPNAGYAPPIDSPAKGSAAAVATAAFIPVAQGMLLSSGAEGGSQVVTAQEAALLEPDTTYDSAEVMEQVRAEAAAAAAAACGQAQAALEVQSHYISGRFRVTCFKLDSSSGTTSPTLSSPSPSSPMLAGAVAEEEQHQRAALMAKAGEAAAAISAEAWRQRFGGLAAAAAEEHRRAVMALCAQKRAVIMKREHEESFASPPPACFSSCPPSISNYSPTPTPALAASLSPPSPPAAAHLDDAVGAGSLCATVAAAPSALAAGAAAALAVEGQDGCTPHAYICTPPPPRRRGHFTITEAVGVEGSPAAGDKGDGLVSTLAPRRLILPYSGADKNGVQGAIARRRTTHAVHARVHFSPSLLEVMTEAEGAVTATAAPADGVEGLTIRTAPSSLRAVVVDGGVPSRAAAAAATAPAQESRGRSSGGGGPDGSSGCIRCYQAGRFNVREQADDQQPGTHAAPAVDPPCGSGLTPPTTNQQAGSQLHSAGLLQRVAPAPLPPPCAAVNNPAATVQCSGVQQLHPPVPELLPPEAAGGCPATATPATPAAAATPPQQPQPPAAVVSVAAAVTAATVSAVGGFMSRRGRFTVLLEKVEGRC